MRQNVITIFLIIIAASGLSCRRTTTIGSASDSVVVLYTSVDEPYAKPIAEQFTSETGIRVTLVTDTEASKSVGLAAKLEAEKDHPAADVWWSNECFLTIRLADAGVLAAYDAPAATDIPPRFKDPAHRWAASVLRVRVLVSSLAGPNHPPPLRSLNDLLRPDLKGRIVLARPTAGTTGGHIAALYALWGDAKAEKFLRALHDNSITLVGGNSIVAETVDRGDLAAGLCDNDDAADAAANIGPLSALLPDQQPGEDGTLAIPCAVALVAQGPHPSAARRLIDFLLSKSAGQKLIDSKFAWCSTRDTTGKGHFMDVDYQAVANIMPRAIRSGTAILEGR